MMSEETRAAVLQLMQQKDKIEEEIRQNAAILTMYGVGMDEPLVDENGYPRNNIDVYGIRHARHRIICLQNDHKNVMKQIESGLEGYYSTAGAQSNGAHNVEMQSDDVNIVPHDISFAKITIVSAGSPADVAGLRPNDLVVEFGSVNSTNFKNITNVAAVVQHSEGNQVPVKIKRAHRFVDLILVPKKWHGKGLLGCNIESL